MEEIDYQQISNILLGGFRDAPEFYDFQDLLPACILSELIKRYPDDFPDGISTIFDKIKIDGNEHPELKSFVNSYIDSWIERDSINPDPITSDHLCMTLVDRAILENSDNEEHRNTAAILNSIKALREKIG